MKIACVVTAAGRASRFGEDKLCRDLNGKPMLTHILESVNGAPVDVRAVVAPCVDGRVASAAASYGFRVLVNERVELGLSESVRVGVSSVCQDVDAILFCVGDQPHLTVETLRGMIERWRQNRDRIVALGYKGTRGNPVIFPKDFFGDLQRLVGDVGGSSVIAAHPGCLLLYETNDERELMDIDTIEDWNRTC